MRVLVVDDEPLARKRLSSLLMKSGLVTSIDQADCASAALGLIREDVPDALFLDISMPGRSGLALALEEGDLPPVVFVTAHPQYGASAFDADAVDYLVKPVRLVRLEQCLQKLKIALRRRAPPTRVETTPPLTRRVKATFRGEDHFFHPARITRFYTSQRFSVFRDGDRELFLDETLASLEQRLADDGFFRLHRHELVNMQAIVSILQAPGAVGEVVRLCDGQVVSGSRRRIRALKKRMVALSRARGAKD
jgi:DNA-binding LytR/AlgR family response regulator